MRSDLCMHCMNGKMVNDVCMNCHWKKTDSVKRRMDALPIGLTLHRRYYIGDVLGSGGFGITYAAWDMQEDRRVAVKELYPSMDIVREKDRCTVIPKKEQEEYFAQVKIRFENEAKLLLNLQREQGVVKLYHFFEEYGTAYYVMEYLDGMNLKDYLRCHGTMPWEKLAPVVKSVLNTLAMLHGKKMIHRDIAPDNIFLTKKGKVLLIDFGTVRMYQGNSPLTVILRKEFAPMEQFKTNGKQGPWTDIYALCVTMYYSLSGKLPPAAWTRILKKDVDLIPIENLCPGLPRHVARAIHKGMEPEIDNRFQDGSQLAQALFPDGLSGEGNRTRQPEHRSAAPVCLKCEAGEFPGRRWELGSGESIRIGRKRDCDIVYPPSRTEVSRRHCTVAMRQGGKLCVRDEGSTYGTYLDFMNRQTKLQPNCWYSINVGYRIKFEGEEYVLERI